MFELRPRGVRTTVRRTEQGRIEAARLCRIARRFGGPAGVVETVEAVWTELEGLPVFDQRYLGVTRFEQHIAEHFAGRNIDLGLADLVLQIRAATHVLQPILPIAVGERDPCQHLAPLDPRPGRISKVRMPSLAHLL